MAEIAAAMACAEAGIAIGQFVIEQHAAYIKSWIECLKADRNAIFVAAGAAGAAERACEYLRKHAVEAKPEEVEAMAVEQQVPEVMASRRRRGM